VVETERLAIESELIVHVPEDIVKNKQRLEVVKEGLKKAMVKGLYEEGVDFEIKKLSMKII
jgi:hypothetical protein